MAEYNYIGDGSPDGSIVVKSATEKLGFYGTAPVVQPSGAAQGAPCLAALATGAVYGFATVAAASTVLNLVDAMRTALINLGLIKGS